ncbi:MAG: tail fiber domain-containing protein [Chromatiaceae bacterium]|nr:tail fiber domain-containing protein [Chromatiaceae bacterium]
MASLKQFIGDAKDFVTRITGLTPWTAPPAINLETTSEQVIAITGETANDTPPVISLKTTSEQIKLITGAAANDTPPAISLKTTSDQIKDITGAAANDTPPAISLKATYNHVQASLADAQVHGMTGFATSILGLAETATAGGSTKVARGDHRHPMPASLWATQGLTPANNTVVRYTGATTAELITVTDAARDLLDDGNAATMRDTLGVSAAGTYDSPTDGTNNLSGATVYKRIGVVNGLVTALVTRDLTAADIGAQAPTTALTALGGLTLAADKLPFFNGATTANVTDFTAYGRVLLAQASYAAMRSLIGAAAVAGSASQAFAASTLTADKVAADDGVTNGIRTSQAAFAFSTTATVALGDGGMYVKNLANNAYVAVNASAFVPSSDERLKSGIRPFARGSALSQLSGLSKTGVIHYRRKNEPATTPERLGFSAQQIAVAAPDAAATIPGIGPDDESLGWDIGAMLALVVDAVGALSDRLDALERGRP